VREEEFSDERRGHVFSATPTAEVTGRLMGSSRRARVFQRHRDALSGLGDEPPGAPKRGATGLKAPRRGVKERSGCGPSKVGPRAQRCLDPMNFEYFAPSSSSRRARRGSRYLDVRDGARGVCRPSQIAFANQAHGREFRSISSRTRCSLVEGFFIRERLRRGISASGRSTRREKWRGQTVVWRAGRIYVQSRGVRKTPSASHRRTAGQMTGEKSESAASGGADGSGDSAGGAATDNGDGSRRRADERGGDAASNEGLGRRRTGVGGGVGERRKEGTRSKSSSTRKPGFRGGA